MMELHIVGEYNGYGALGDGSNTNRSVPTPIFGGFEFTKVVGGGSYSGSAAIQKTCDLL